MIWLFIRYPQDGHAKKDSSKVWFIAAVYPSVTFCLIILQPMISTSFRRDCPALIGMALA